jgi:TonB-linked SusC/RagA family outer membrane protein
MKSIFRPKKILLLLGAWLFAISIYAQERTITGSVVDAGTNEPLIGATVVVVGSNAGTVTDLDGQYSISAKDGDVLRASYIGYLTEESVIEGQSNVAFSLSPDLQALEEVVVIGYGTVKKEDATGSVTAVSSKDFNKGAITSPQDLLVGKSAGVSITNSGGSPGAGATIRIRGGSSLRASNDPLIIVDGVPISSGGADGDANFLSFVNPNDIETFTVLKDASATAIYGSRASNGVIIITTKKGNEGKPLTLSYNGNVSYAMPINFIDVYSGDEMREIAWEYQDIFDPIVFDRLGKENTDWQQEVFRNSVSHDHNISAAGSVSSVPYRVSLGYTDQQGIVENTDMQRFTSSVSLDPSLLNDALKINVNAKYMNTNNNFGDAGAIGSAIGMDPSQPIEDGNAASAGYYQWENYGANLGTPNPVEQVLVADNKSVVNRFVGNVQFNYTLPFLPDLKANLNLATDYSESEGFNNRPVTSPSRLTNPTNGRLNDYSSIRKNNLLDFYVNYVKDLGSIQNVNLTAGYSWQHFENEGDRYTRGIVDEDNPYQRTDSVEYFSENYLVSFFGRLNYTLMNKYLLTGTVRNDGSSRFAEGNQWGFFPSVAFAWKINEEAFLSSVSAISELKLRLGWGITGQQDIPGGDYPSLARYTISQQGSYYQIGEEFIPTLRPEAYDPDIQWEETTTQNIGLDFGVLDGRIAGSIDAYKRITDKLINQVNIPSGSNFSNTLITNVGSLENQGIEIALNLVPISTKDISLNIGYNFTLNRTEVTKLLISDDPDYIGILYGSAFTGQNQVTRVGEAPYSFFLNQQVYDDNGDPIEGLYVDLQGQGGAIYNTNENKRIFKNPAPDYTMGLSLRFAYKDFDLSASSRASIGNYAYNSVAAGASYDQMQQIGYWLNMPKYLDDTKFITRQFTSDYFVENASFFKVDNITAGYNFRDIADKFTLRMNITVQNAFTVTNYSGLDPEVPYSNGVPGVDGNTYPRPRTFLLGFSINY